MNVYEEQLKEVVRATSIKSSTAFSWLGVPSPRLPNRTMGSLTEKTARSYLVYSLSTRLYNDFFTRGAVEPGRWEPPSSIVSRGPLIEEMSQANAGAGYWEEGWMIRACREQDAVVVKNGLELTVRASSLLSRPRVGEPVSVRFPKEFRAVSPGFYMACGDHVRAGSDRYSLVRLYWNLRVSGAVAFVAAATARLNELAVPFQLKVLNDSTSFYRCDAAVLYLREPYFAELGEELTHLHKQLARHLDFRTPALTKVLAPGLGFALDPGGGESFGQHRSRLLADGLVLAFESRAKSVDDRMKVVTERFASEGITLNEPYKFTGHATTQERLAK
jgi:hypothetical protein